MDILRVQERIPFKELCSLSIRFKFWKATDVYEVGVDVVGAVDASDWLQTDARCLICT